MNEAEFELFEKAANAKVRRLNADNTWLRHTLKEIDTRVQALHDQMAALEKRARAIKKGLPVVAAPAPKAKPKTQKSTTKSTTNSRSKK